MSFAHPKLPTSRSCNRAKGSSTLSYRQPPVQTTAAFRSTGKTFEFHNPKINAAPPVLIGNMVHSFPSKHLPANWDNLLLSSRTIHEEKLTKTNFRQRRTEYVKSARTVCPELQDEPVVSPRKNPRNPLKSFLDESQRTSEMKSITGCERRHNEQMYQETCQAPMPRPYSVGLSQSADSEIIKRLHKERNIDQIGSPSASQIKDPIKCISPRPYSLQHLHKS